MMKTFRSLAAVILSALMAAELVQALPYGSASASAFLINIPSSLGYVSETYSPASAKAMAGGPDVILIQNLHVNRSVQFAISGILKRLKAQGLMPDHIAVEGATGPVDIGFMQRYPDPVIRKKAADYLVQQGEMPGAIHFAVSEGEGGLFGIETDEYYQANLEMFRRSYKERTALREEIEKIQAVLPKLKKDPATWENASILEKDIEAVSRLINNQVIPDELPATLRQATEAVEHLKQVLPNDSAEGGTRSAEEGALNEKLPSSALIESLSASINFYALALLRNDELFKNALAVRELGHQKTSIVVTGGFHTAALAEAFKQRGMSYAIITPNIKRADKVDETLYVERLLDHHLTPQQIETGEDWASMGVMSGPVAANKLEAIWRLWNGAWDAATTMETTSETAMGRREAVKGIFVGVLCLAAGACGSSSPGPTAPSPTGSTTIFQGQPATIATPPSAFAAYANGNFNVPIGSTLDIHFPPSFAGVNVLLRLLPSRDLSIAGTSNVGVRFIPITIQANGIASVIINPSEFTGLSASDFPFFGQIAVLSGDEAYNVPIDQLPSVTNPDAVFDLITDNVTTASASDQETPHKISLTLGSQWAPEKAAALPGVKRQSVLGQRGFSITRLAVTLGSAVIVAAIALAYPIAVHAAGSTGLSAGLMLADTVRPMINHAVQGIPTAGLGIPVVTAPVMVVAALIAGKILSSGKRLKLTLLAALIALAIACGGNNMTSPTPTPTPSPTSSVLLSQNFASISSLDPSIWVSNAVYILSLNRTQMGRLIHPDATEINPQLPPISGGLVYLNVHAYNPTALTRGDSYQGSEMDTSASYSVSPTNGISFKATYRFLSPVPAGIVGAMFAYSYNNNIHDEIDIERFSQGGGDTNVYHGPDATSAGNPQSITGFDPTIFHDYEIRWYSTRVEEYIDNTLVRTATTDIPNQPMTFRLNAWVPGPQNTFAGLPGFPTATNYNDDVTYSVVVKSVEVDKLTGALSTASGAIKGRVVLPGPPAPARPQTPPPTHRMSSLSPLISAPPGLTPKGILVAVLNAVENAVSQPTHAQAPSGEPLGTPGQPTQDPSAPPEQLQQLHPGLAVTNIPNDSKGLVAAYLNTSDKEIKNLILSRLFNKEDLKPAWSNPVFMQALKRASSGELDMSTALSAQNLMNQIEINRNQRTTEAAFIFVAAFIVGILGALSTLFRGGRSRSKKLRLLAVFLMLYGAGVHPRTGEAQSLVGYLDSRPGGMEQFLSAKPAQVRALYYESHLAGTSPKDQTVIPPTDSVSTQEQSHPVPAVQTTPLQVQSNPAQTIHTAQLTPGFHGTLVTVINPEKPLISVTIYFGDKGKGQSAMRLKIGPDRKPKGLEGVIGVAPVNQLPKLIPGPTGQLTLRISLPVNANSPAVRIETTPAAPVTMAEETQPPQAAQARPVPPPTSAKGNEANTRGNLPVLPPLDMTPIQTRGDAVEAGELLKSIYRWAKTPGSVSVEIAKNDPKAKEFIDNFEVETDLSGSPTNVTYKRTQIFSVTPVPVGADAYVKKDEGYGIYLGPGDNTLTVDVPGARVTLRGTYNPTLGNRPVPFGLSPGIRPLDFTVTVIPQPRRGADAQPQPLGPAQADIARNVSEIADGAVSSLGHAWSTAARVILVSFGESAVNGVAGSIGAGAQPVGTAGAPAQATSNPESSQVLSPNYTMVNEKLVGVDPHPAPIEDRSGRYYTLTYVGPFPLSGVSGLRLRIPKGPKDESWAETEVEPSIFTYPSRQLPKGKVDLPTGSVDSTGIAKIHIPDGIDINHNVRVEVRFYSDRLPEKVILEADWKSAPEVDAAARPDAAARGQIHNVSYSPGVNHKVQTSQHRPIAPATKDRQPEPVEMRTIRSLELVPSLEGEANVLEGLITADFLQEGSPDALQMEISLKPAPFKIQFTNAQLANPTLALELKPDGKLQLENVMSKEAPGFFNLLKDPKIEPLADGAYKVTLVFKIPAPIVAALRVQTDKTDELSTVTVSILKTVSKAKRSAAARPEPSGSMVQVRTALLSSTPEGLTPVHFIVTSVEAAAHAVAAFFDPTLYANEPSAAPPAGQVNPASQDQALPSVGTVASQELEFVKRDGNFLVYETPITPGMLRTGNLKITIPATGAHKFELHLIVPGGHDHKLNGSIQKNNQIEYSHITSNGRNPPSNLLIESKPAGQLDSDSNITVDLPTLHIPPDAILRVNIDTSSKPTITTRSVLPPAGAEARPAVPTAASEAMAASPDDGIHSTTPGDAAGIGFGMLFGWARLLGRREKKGDVAANKYARRLDKASPPAHLHSVRPQPETPNVQPNNLGAAVRPNPQPATREGVLLHKDIFPRKLTLAVRGVVGLAILGHFVLQPAAVFAAELPGNGVAPVVIVDPTANMGILAHLAGLGGYTNGVLNFVNAAFQAFFARMSHLQAVDLLTDQLHPILSSINLHTIATAAAAAVLSYAIVYLARYTFSEEVRRRTHERVGRLLENASA